MLIKNLCYPVCQNLQKRSTGTCERADGLEEVDTVACPFFVEGTESKLSTFTIITS